MEKSNFLEDVITKQNKITSLQVVFLDIEKYSKRRTTIQVNLIDKFTELVQFSLNEISKMYVSYAQKNNLNFSNDIVVIPTGDGAAVVFPFEGVHDIHLNFAKIMLSEIHKYNESNKCDEFKKEGWCNCHLNLNVRVGISEGKGIIYKDINGNYNVAGNVINLASRVMGLADRNQIILTQEAHDQIIDLTDIPDFYKEFVEYNDIEIKHRIKISVYQYLGNGEEFINSEQPSQLFIRQKSNEMVNKFKDIKLNMDNEKDFIEFLDGFMGLMSKHKKE